MTDSLSIGRFLVTQRQLAVSETLTTPYDLFITAVSWEARNLTAIKAISGFQAPTLLLRFGSGKANEAKDKNQESLRILCPNHTHLSLNASIDFDRNIEAIETALKDHFDKKGLPLKVLLDITCIPKSYISFLCGAGFSNDYIARLDCLYSEGRYDLAVETSPGGPLSIISLGEWTSIQVPYLEAENMFSTHRDLLVILGGEISHSLPFIERYEPRRLGIVCIKDGCDPTKLIGRERAALEELVSEPTLERGDYPIEDLAGVLKHVHDFCRGSEGRGVSGLAIGAKSQSLALALAALDIDNLEVICRIPTSYSANDVLPTGRVFLYTIEDRFEPTGYINAPSKGA